jgi:hypothetical protein
LETDKLEEIYDKQYFVLNSIVNKRYTRIEHSKYKFIFNHDYLVTNGSITNYDICAERFKLKISNFISMMNNTKPVLLINFSEAPHTINISGLEQYFKKHNKKFILLIFTNVDSKPIVSDSVYMIKLEQDYTVWWTLPQHTKNLLYKEIYEKFINTLDIINIAHTFPSVNQVITELQANLKCSRPTCNFKKHTSTANNGGTHCCRACKINGTHGPACAKHS